MNEKKIYVGGSALKSSGGPVEGHYVDIDGERYYMIANFDSMPPFFMSIVSDSDHWMFISSNGALTAGRKNADNALFPYYTDDRITDSLDLTGGKTIVFSMLGTKSHIWEPFSNRYEGIYETERNIYKNIVGNKIIFEEINRDLCLAFQFTWQNSDRFGFVKTSKISNMAAKPVDVNMLDGVQNVLPAGLDRRFQLEYSTLADGYKRCEYRDDTGLGIYSLSSIPVDKAEPSEALLATTIWSVGLENSKKLLSSRQLQRFRNRQSVEQETDIRGARGAYFVNAEFQLDGYSEKEWYVIADINRDAADVAVLDVLLQNGEDLVKEIHENIALGTVNLKKIVASADGLQTTADALSSSRHFSNVLFNVMRGGIFDSNYTIEKSDFLSFIENANKPLFRKHSGFFKSIPAQIQLSDLKARVTKLYNADLMKLCYEYLPLTFSRRHGDPSRPWNMFSIEVRDKSGEKILNYQGNWRDIFQNWEALGLSFPGYIPNMICKFLNASTADGYNPYRLTRDGFEWEVLDPSDPWSYIGYWGDHQIIYLLKLLQLSDLFSPDALHNLLTRNIFSYADVPYRIKSYEDLLKDPHNTIEFDTELNRQIEKRVESIGGDGKFIHNDNGHMVHANLTEKLLVSVLAKLTNFIPEAGIWMNTQRPEWNDANNALVGYGVSMVTLYYLRRFLFFFRKLLQTSEIKNIKISVEISDLLSSLTKTFVKNVNLLERPISNRDRKKILDQLGRAGEEYRHKVYALGFCGKQKEIAVTELEEFCGISLKYMDHSIEANRRPDKLFHAYNLMEVESDREISIRHLSEMLEGQVAVLSSGFLSAKETIDVLDALKKSALFRQDQYSYILYPDRELSGFIAKNNIPTEKLEKSTLLKSLVKEGNDQIVVKDVRGGFHFNSDFRNARILEKALFDLKNSEWKRLVTKEANYILEIYENIFDHRSFTGRSGTFFKYEGLGSIYWHMVSKLLLAIQETFYRAVESGVDESIRSKLIAHYYDVRAGIGQHKSPESYGAFPSDPYSHTPAYTGVQQPGMTGQVKEDILTRFGEFGVFITEGEVSFRGELLKKEEFLESPESFFYYDIHGTPQNIDLDRNSLAFTFCQIPIVYCLSADNKTILTRQDGSKSTIPGHYLGTETSAHVFTRDGEIKRIDVYLTPSL